MDETKRKSAETLGVVVQALPDTLFSVKLENDT